MLRIVKLRSPMSLGSCALFFFGFFSGASAFLQFLADMSGANLLPGLRRTLGILGLPFSLFISGYTGLLLAATNVPLWARSSPLLGSTFISSAFSTSLSALSLLLGMTGTESKRTTYELVIEDTDFKAVQKGCYTNKDVTEGSLGPFYMSYPYERYDMVAILSDGATSFQKTSTTLTSKRQESVPVCNILSEVLHFKNYNGQFVQRRCKAAFRKFSEDNCVNMDDFSLGVLYRPEES